MMGKSMTKKGRTRPANRGNKYKVISTIRCIIIACHKVFTLFIVLTSNKKNKLKKTCRLILGFKCCLLLAIAWHPIVSAVAATNTATTLKQQTYAAEHTLGWKKPGTSRRSSPGLMIRQTDESPYLGASSAILPEHTYRYFNSSGLRGENYPIEVEIGASGQRYNIPKLEPDYGLVRLYTDLWAPWANKNTAFGKRRQVYAPADRSELHFAKLFGPENILPIAEGDSLWVGYSQFYTHLDAGCRTHTFQFHHTRGVGPSTGILLYPQNNKLYFQVQQRSGPAQPAINNAGTVIDSWQLITPKKQHTHIEAKTGVWFTMIMQIKYSRTDDGLFRLWIYEHNKTPVTFNVSDTPAYSRTGNTMYSSSTNNSDQFEIRLGQYRWCRKPPNTPTKPSERYTNMYLGPIRLDRSADNSGFYRVMPKLQPVSK